MAWVLMTITAWIMARATSRRRRWLGHWQGNDQIASASQRRKPMSKCPFGSAPGGAPAAASPPRQPNGTAGVRFGLPETPLRAREAPRRGAGPLDRGRRSGAAESLGCGPWGAESQGRGERSRRSEATDSPARGCVGLLERRVGRNSEVGGSRTEAGVTGG